MSYALKVARAQKGKVCMICKTSLDEANTSFAQGGVASVTNLEVDNFDKHIQDTMIAGDYIRTTKLCSRLSPKHPNRSRSWCSGVSTSTSSRTASSTFTVRADTASSASSITPTIRC